jgi:hypothetical protein
MFGGLYHYLHNFRNYLVIFTKITINVKYRMTFEIFMWSLSVTINIANMRPDPIVEVSRSHSDTQHSLGHLWTSDQPVAETTTCKHTTLTTDRQPSPKRDLNLQFQQASGCRPSGNWNWQYVLVVFSIFSWPRVLILSLHHTISMTW